ncbi:unnamed protein product [Soboliphyme baturini]|uniref:PLD-like domain-containing protein n=1 Tax=Soboliphyme baturini TaxID=241478 RepID=A0A3P8C7Y5_9BILA|nr:unnamed protein product [Soboliphyme baturini]
MFFQISPSTFCSRGRDDDLSTILKIIATAKKFIYVAVMNYIPITLSSSASKYWPMIDDALRSAAYENGVAVKLIISHWNHSHEQMFAFLRSLSTFAASLERGSLEIVSHTLKNCLQLPPIFQKLFYVPVYNERQGRIPNSRVNHNKYMVTEETAYIGITKCLSSCIFEPFVAGTSNWVGDYFIDTAGIGSVIQQEENDIKHDLSVVRQLQQVFIRDWNSSFATYL